MTARIEKDIFDYNVSGIDAFEPSVRTPEQMKKFKDSLILSLSNLIKENPNDQITYVKRTIDGKNYLCLQNKDVAWPLPLSSY
jgi:hypothetical protein